MKPPLAIERLAIAICWAEFVVPPEGKTANSYWLEIHEDARSDYRRDAVRLAYWARNFGQEKFWSRVASAVLHLSPSPPTGEPG